MFALRLYQKTAQSIARAYGVKLGKNGPIEIAENTVLLWAYDWTEEGRPGGGGLLITQSRQDAANVLARKDARTEARHPREVATMARPFAYNIDCEVTAMDHVMPIWEAIQTTLDEMAKKFITRENPYALRCYLYSHRKLFPASFPGDRWEESITAGLAQELCDKGISACTEQLYPCNSERCDLVVQLSSGETLWIECKTAYRMDLGKDLDGNNPKECFGKRSWKAGVADIEEKDIKKLNTLRLPSAQYIGILLFGFDRDRDGERIEIDELYGLLPDELRSDNWVAAHGKNNPKGLLYPDRYSRRAEIGYQDRLWFWYRPVTK
jgi:hypothetical protein